MKAIILAAGRGSRLYPYTKYIPKCLLDIGGETIIEHQLNYIRECGIDEVAIVVGFGFDKVESFLRDYDGLGVKIKTLYNPFYQSTNSLISLWMARCEMDQDTVVINGDDVFERSALEKIVGMRDEKICLPIKVKNSYEEEDMKVVVRGERLVDIGKNILRPSAESVGIRVFRGMWVELMKRAIEEEVRTEGAERKWYVSAVERLLSKGYKIRCFDIEGLFWMDVDYPRDLLRARFNSYRFLKKSPEKRLLKIAET